MNRKFSIAYKILTVLALFTGIVLNLIKTTSAISLLSYYTLQSNIICLIAFICYSINEIRDKSGSYRKSDIYYLVKGALIIMIFITTFFYHIALSPFGFNMDLNPKDLIIKKIANFFVHSISPVLVILDYFFFDEKGKFKMYYPFLWLFLPFNYVMYVYFYASLGGTFFGVGGSKQFAYFFLDYIELGILSVIKWLIIMALVILLISYILIIIDRILKKRKRTKRKS